MIKSLYHTFAFCLLFVIAIAFMKRPYFTRNNTMVIVFLLAIAVFHAYDVWWFSCHEGPAPI
jgi:hypothetical protein